MISSLALVILFSLQQGDLEAALRGALKETWGTGEDMEIEIDASRVLPEVCCHRVVTGPPGSGWRSAVVWATPDAQPRGVRFRVWQEVRAARATRAIERGERLDASSSEITSQRLPYGTEHVSSVEDGLVARRLLAKGEIIVPGQNVVGESVVSRGMSVEVVIRSGTVEIRRPAVSLTESPAGGRARVRLSDGRVLDTIAVGPGLVHLSHSCPSC